LVKNALTELGGRLDHVNFRMMKTKWASLSSRNNLTINKLTKYLPEHLLNYIVFHEIAHLRTKRHNETFWKMISINFRNYKELERNLFIYWFQVMGRIR
jgi:predicted metal-dependent hydrolase